MNTKNLYYEGQGQSLLKPMNYKKQVQHSYVDLGLPSGTLWATMNVGALSETDYGNHYMYGMGRKTYDYTDAPYAGDENLLAKSADTAAQEWGGNWHTPTQEQYQELLNTTTHEWVTNYQNSGVNGILFTAQNENSIFLPAAGFLLYDRPLENVNSECRYWTSSSNNSVSAQFLDYEESYSGLNGHDRNYGYSIRPVMDKS